MLENIYEELVKKVNDGFKCVMLTYLNLYSDRDGTITKKIILTCDEIQNKLIILSDDIYNEIQLSMNTGKIRVFNIEEKKSLIIEPFIPKPRLIVFGGGHIAMPLSEFASKANFSVTVIDDRPFFANKKRFPKADKVICESFEKSFSLLNLRKSDYVAIITRGHRYDGLVLREVLKYDLSYVGMIGSKRRVKGMMEELLSEGFSSDKLNLVNSPIGIDIYAITPDEIAFSIIAELISFKNKGTINNSGEKFVIPEFDIDVAEKIFVEAEISKALITILSSKGSVPRKAGAKMIAYYDGRTIGSIGGGCSEAAVIVKAREIMVSKGFIIEHVDMTGEVAEDEGMVCGGVMEVLIESF
ncbi:XdhC family protein [Clostridium frigoris]|uniref:XdhC family protein n=1 Tax=Clostridium frigoris TaxID=205327 RepID=A0ABS6BZ06_9CLOT|nr:XdhC/CoxI family protein [Clostridium frigoris]MBU3161823.1 XdhC family protein [Clostridium frigoris]